MTRCTRITAAHSRYMPIKICNARKLILEWRRQVLRRQPTLRRLETEPSIPKWQNHRREDCLRRADKASESRTNLISAPVPFFFTLSLWPVSSLLLLNFSWWLLRDLNLSFVVVYSHIWSRPCASSKQHASIMFVFAIPPFTLSGDSYKRIFLASSLCWMSAYYIFTAFGFGRDSRYG